MCWIRLIWNAERIGKFIPQQRCCTSKRTVSDLEMRLNWRMKEGDHRCRASRSWRLGGNDIAKVMGTGKL